MEEKSLTSPKLIWGICGILQVILFDTYKITGIFLWIFFQICIILLEWNNYEDFIKNKLYYSMLFVSMEIFFQVLIDYMTEIFGLNGMVEIWKKCFCIFLIFIFLRGLQIYFQRTHVVLKTSIIQYFIMIFILIGNICMLGQWISCEWLEKNIFERFDRSTLIIFFIVLFVQLLMFHEIKSTSKIVDAQQKNAIYCQEIKYYHQYIEDKKDEAEKMKEMRHDMKQKIFLMKDLLNKKQYVELKKFYDQLTEELEISKAEIANTGNIAVDGMINSKYAIAKQQEINMMVNLDIPSELPFINTDLCIILGNALDNAIEACTRSKIKEMWIKVIMKYDNGNLLILIENSFDGILEKKSTGGFFTLKKDKESHGFGMQSIQRVVNKYNGFSNFSAKNEIFYLRIILYQE